MEDVNRKLLKKNRFGEGYSLTLYPADAVWGASLLLMFAVCFELFYRMIVNYNGHYKSDVPFYAVENMTNGVPSVRMLDFVYRFLYSINHTTNEINICMAATIVAIIIMNYVSIRYFIKEDGYLDIVPRYAMQFFSVALLFTGSVYVPFIFERYYRHTFKAFAWHSPTQQAMTLFALIASLCFLKMYVDYEEKGVNPWWWIATVISVFLATFPKPSYTMNLMAAVVVMFLFDLIKGGREGFAVRFRRLFIMGCSLIPSGLYLIHLNTVKFTDNMQYGEEHEVIFGISQVLSYDRLWGAILFGCAVPIVVFAFNTQRFKDSRYRFALYIFVMGMLQWGLITESGQRGEHGNFTWGRMIGIYYLTLAAACVAMEIWYDKDGRFADDRRKRTLYLILLGIVFAASILSQLNYFRLILTGHGYQL